MTGGLCWRQWRSGHVAFLSQQAETGECGLTKQERCVSTLMGHIGHTCATPAKLGQSGRVAL
jgi:hypothetical protein